MHFRLICSRTEWARAIRSDVPELPEVESVRRSLLPLVRGRVVVDVVLYRRDVVIAPGDPVGGHARQRKRAGACSPRAVSSNDLLHNARITDILRRGKQMAIITEPGRALVVQLGMTGTLERVSPDDQPDAHTHAVWTMDSGARFRFHDPRRFGGLRVFASRGELEAHWALLGPDALTIRGEELRSALAGSKRAIKAALLDQGVLAGVGNIYADESLFRSGINPRFRADRLSDEQVALLASSIREILTHAVSDGGSTLRDYADAEGKPGSYQSRHAVYGRGGLPCQTCGRMLATGLLVQRTTVWCRGCQPARRTRPK